MPALSYSAVTHYPFSAFTKIYSADVNGLFAAIQTLLNTTKLDSTNVQVHGLVRNGATSNLAAGTASYAVYNDSSGDLTEAAQLPPAQGGTGGSFLTSNPLDSGKAIVVNTAGTGYQLAGSSSATLNIFNYLNLT